MKDGYQPTDDGDKSRPPQGRSNVQEVLVELCGPKFHITPRMQLRITLLDMVVRAAAINGVKITGADLQKEVENLEKWIESVEHV
jgi:hypothetical protein